jgi:serine/threonine protein kinase
MFKHENIVELYEYFENKEDIVMLMEYCNDAKYFENKIENVSLKTSINHTPLPSATHPNKKRRQTALILNGHPSRLAVYP